MTELKASGLSASTAPDPQDQLLADNLLTTVGRVRRRMQHAVGRPFGSRLSHAQGEVMRHVRRHPGASIKQTARALALAPNTVSTLVASLAEEGLLDRMPDPGDLRIARLTLTPQAREPLEAWRRERNDAVASTLSSLGPEQRADLERGLAVLRLVAEQLAEGPVDD